MLKTVFFYLDLFVSLQLDYVYTSSKISGEIEHMHSLV